MIQLLHASPEQSPAPSDVPETLVIRGDFSIATVAEWHRQLVRLCRLEATAVVDLSEVETCDVFALQLLCALRHSGAKRSRPIRITRASRPVLDTATAAGIATRAFLEEQP